MKTAKVSPLLKNGCPKCTDNYHPISLLPVISKVLERVVFDFMTRFLAENKILYPKQFGFRSNHSTSDAILNFIGNVLQSFKKI